MAWSKPLTLSGGHYIPPPIPEILVPEFLEFPESGCIFLMCSFTIQNNSGQNKLLNLHMEFLEYQNNSIRNPVNKTESGSQYDCRNKIFAFIKN